MNGLIKIPNDTREKNELLVELTLQKRFQNCSKINLKEFEYAVRKEADHLGVCSPASVLLAEIIAERFPVTIVGGKITEPEYYILDLKGS